jgi:hypothetical protein
MVEWSNQCPCAIIAVVDAHASCLYIDYDRVEDVLGGAS